MGTARDARVTPLKSLVAGKRRKEIFDAKGGGKIPTLGKEIFDARGRKKIPTPGGEQSVGFDKAAKGTPPCR